MMTPIALYLAKQLEDTHPSDNACQLLMYNAAEELRKQHDKIKEREASVLHLIAAYEEAYTGPIHGDTGRMLKEHLDTIAAARSLL